MAAKNRGKNGHQNTPHTHPKICPNLQIDSWLQKSRKLWFRSHQKYAPQRGHVVVFTPPKRGENDDLGAKGDTRVDVARTSYITYRGINIRRAKNPYFWHISYISSYIKKTHLRNIRGVSSYISSYIKKRNLRNIRAKGKLTPKSGRIYPPFSTLNLPQKKPIISRPEMTARTPGMRCMNLGGIEG